MEIIKTTKRIKHCTVSSLTKDYDVHFLNDGYVNIIINKNYTLVDNNIEITTETNKVSKVTIAVIKVLDRNNKELTLRKVLSVKRLNLKEIPNTPEKFYTLNIDKP